MTSSKTALVLGAGGVVGMAYHAGVLRALEQVAGFVPNDADLIVGTSAGSAVAAYLRTGWTTEDFWLLAQGQHPEMGPIGGAVAAERRRRIMAPAFRTPIEAFRRSVGSAYVLGRSVVRIPMPLPRAVKRAFPGGLFAMAEGKQRFAEELPEKWPERALWLCSVDIESGRRIVLGRPGSPPTSLAQAVMASCAIPAVYQPVRVRRMTLVDGGAHSTSNLDLAAKAGCSLVIGVIPMAWDTSGRPPNLGSQLMRQFAVRTLTAEVSYAKAKGCRVLLVRPTPPELRLHGVNLMRPEGIDRVARAAYDAAARMLETPRFRDALSAA